MALQLKIASLTDLPMAAQNLVEFLRKSRIKNVAFYGEMGAGKTTLISAMLTYMGVESNAASPTFSIVNENYSAVYGKIYHFDFYRLNSPTEALDFGIEEIFSEQAWCLMEWPEKIGNLLPEKHVTIRITVDEHECRLIEAKV